MKRVLRHLEDKIQYAEDYASWRQACLEHDQLSGAEEWKARDRSSDYDYQLIRTRIQHIERTRERGDVHKLVFHMHEGLHGSLGNISNPNLYLRSKAGTKHLIERYLTTVCDALNYICDTELDDFTLADKLNFFNKTGRAFGQTALMLSGGAALGLFHIGVCKSLWEEGLLPKVISGSSAGAIIAGVLGTHSDAELAEKLQPESLYLEAFKYVGWRGVLKGTPVLDGDYLEKCLDENIPDMTFREAYEHTGREINIPVSPYDRHQHGRLLNHKTSPNVLIRKAVLASCAIPGIYPPVSLWAKNMEGQKVPYIPGRKFVDGSISDDLPIRRLSRLYGINHSIVSQTNPHVVPFMSRSQAIKQGGVLPITRTWIRRNIAMNASFGLDLLHDRVESNDLGLVVDKIRSVLMQKYDGDINIIPPRKPLNVLRVLANPSVEDVREYIRNGERTTWPRMDMIRNTTMISRTFRDCMHRLNKQGTERIKAGGQPPTSANNVVTLDQANK